MCDQNERHYEMTVTLLGTESCGVLRRGYLGTRNLHNRESSGEQQQCLAAQHFDARLGLSQHPPPLRSTQRHRYARQRSSSLILLDTVHKSFIHQMAPIIDPVTVQAI